MFIAQIQTAAGPLTIGLTNISQEQTNASISALLEVLSQVTDPIEVTGDEVYVQEADDDTPTTMAFKYLGSGTIQFEDLAAYTTTMNEKLALNEFLCATEVRSGEGGTLVVDFESFELLDGEKPDSSTAVH